MPSMFNARDADNYERLMGRWSRRLAPLFIEHAGIADGENVIEVGCGTGSLTFTLPQKAALGRLTAVDHSEIYLAAAKAKNKDPRISLEARRRLRAALPRCELRPRVVDARLALGATGARADGGRDAAGHPPGRGGCCRVLGFTGREPQPARGVGYAAALDEAAAEARDRTMGRPIYAPGALARMWMEAGLVDIDQRSLMIRMDFADFADYWQPFASGEGALGAYVATLGDAARDRLERHLREAYLTGRPDGDRSFVAVALSCRGVVPKD